ncbi:hypothetical protein FJQ54_01040 [Sandaracinobacter neustonicus]|uniref:Tetratricopeptide repeat protein n=1 Tax=Sandaracinobacter neustonicus TaxID=1715348 RepID=A0A501XVR7_9SPHN|nr:hypothetical protein [Sandaracinobacter neustonicus]TPE64615.1 hypothetical protein FJQ54_01040 [Sandaracinobacter neustonicus]
MKLRAALLLLLATPVVAAPASPDELFMAGDYREAAAAGRALGTTQGYLLAGRATAARATLQATDKAVARELLKLAQADFDSALAKSPGEFDALLQKAVVIGYRAKLDSAPALAKQARRNFEAILARNPENPLANAALAGWHGESVATLGGFVAGAALGAKESEAIRLYEKAITLPGADPMVPHFYALNLLSLSADNAPRAKALLQRSLKAPPRDGFEMLLQKQARVILPLL